MKVLVLPPLWSNVLALWVTKAFHAKSAPRDTQGHLRAFIWDFANLVNVLAILQFAILRLEFVWWVVGFFLSLFDIGRGYLYSFVFLDWILFVKAEINWVFWGPSASQLGFNIVNLKDASHLVSNTFSPRTFGPPQLVPKNKQSQLIWSPRQLVPLDNWSPKIWSPWTNGPQDNWSPWTNSPQTFGPHGQMVPKTIGPHGQLVPKIY